MLLLPLSTIATPPQETFLPPQRIPIEGNVFKMVVADVNGDKYDDIVALTTSGIDVYMNEGKTRASGEDVTFVKQHLALTTHENREAAEAKIKFSGGGDLQVVDIDDDGKPDLLASWAGSGEIFVLWNQGTNAPAPFVFVPDTDLATDPSMTILSPLAQRAGDDVLGTPIFVAAANLGDGSGRKSIVAYHGSLQRDPASTQPAPFNQRNYEALGIIYPLKGTARGFDVYAQRTAWPGCDLSFGGGSPGCIGWNDAMPANASLYIFRIADGARMNFDDAASDVLTPDALAAGMTYQPAVLRPNASPGFQIARGLGANGSDTIWLEGGQQVNEFVHDNALKLMRRRTALPTIEGNERSGGSAFATLSTGATALITAGGEDVYYDPSNPGSVAKQPMPEYLDRAGQVGAWLGWAKLNTGSALLSLSDYCRSPDPCMNTTAWYHTPLDGSAPPVAQWGGTHTLVMLDYAKETTVSGHVQLEPFYGNLDDGRFQAFSITSGSVNHKPFIAGGNFASPTERAVVMLDHQDVGVDDPMFTHLVLYRPDVAKTYASPVPHLDGLTVGRFIQDGLTDIGNTLPKGEVSGVLVGAQLGAGIADAIRYVIVRDKATDNAVGVFPVDPPENVSGIGKDGIVVPGLSTLDIGSYTLEAHNANASASMDLKIVNPFGIVSTNYDWSAGGECGILPNTKDGGLWPKQIAVSVADFPGADKLQAVRWIKTDGTVVDLPASGYAAYDAASTTVTLTLPQDGKLTDGRWRPFIKADGVWQEMPRSWNISHDSVTLEFCAKQVTFVNEEAYAQCTNDDYYLDAAQYKVWPHLVNGSFRFFGSGFAQAHIQSAALKQGDKRFFSTSLELVSDNEIHVSFGDLGDALTSDADIDLYFYSASGDAVAADGISASGGKSHWRKAKRGSCLASVPHYSSIAGGSAKDGAIQAGDVITAAGENLMYPVPTANRLILTDAMSGAKYALPPRLPDDIYETHYDNTNGKLLFVIPEDDQWDQYKVADGDGLVEGWAPPPYVSYIIEAGTTAATEATAAAWAAAGGGVLLGGTAGIYLSGNTPTGVVNFIRPKLGLPTPTPGKSGDDQPKDPDAYYVGTYMSNDLEPDGSIYVTVFSTPSWAGADDVVKAAKLAIYMQARGRYTDPRNVSIWPCESSDVDWVDACMVGITPVTGPYNNKVVYDSTVWSEYYVPTNFFPGYAIRTANAVYDPSGLFVGPSRADQFVWRYPAEQRTNYSWTPTTVNIKSISTNQSHNCKLPINDADLRCYQVPVLP
ncbi:MAG TPA: VCBS repeat-containing protein [Rudaea sp.]|nr:VCBS repeat-containing protein [Rudaea sp.]